MHFLIIHTYEVQDKIPFTLRWSPKFLVERKKTMKLGFWGFSLLISIECEPNKIRIYTELFSFNRFFDRTNDKRKILSFAILRNRVENGQFRAYFDRIWIENLTFILKIRQ